jgi:integrase
MKQGSATKTIKDTLSDLSSLWRWSKGRKLGIKENPWTGLSGSLPKQKRGVADIRRPWNVQELTILLRGIPTADPLLAMSVLALYTGMRANEIAEIRHKDIHTAHIEIPEAKTEAGKRNVPLHPLIKPLVQCLKKTSSEGYLIKGLTRSGADGKRAHYITKRFGRMKVRLGLTDSGLVFQPLRNTFIHACENAGVPENVAKLIVCHSRSSMTFGVTVRG